MTSTLAEKKEGFFLRNLIKIFGLIIILTTIALYGNTVFNHYSLDDTYIVNSESIQKGIAGIPEIFNTLYELPDDYTDEAYGYRPITRTIFAIEFQFSGGNTYVSHGINVLLYLLSVLLLYKILRRLLRNYNAFLPFLITLLFMAHPIHTEVVASLKNRDEILAFGFFLLSLNSFLRYIDINKKYEIFLGILFFILALLSKVSILSVMLVFPLTFYFFTDLKPKKIFYFVLIVLAVTAIGSILPRLFLPEIIRPMKFIENPIAFDDNFWNRIGTGFYILFYYLKLLFFPHPLSYFYGYNTIPITNLANIWVLLSIAIYILLFIIAIYGFIKKRIYSYAILFYFVTIAAYANIIALVPGMLAERFLLIPSLGFIIAIVYLLFLVFNYLKEKSIKFNMRLAGILIIVILILIPYSVKTFNRNKVWRTQYTLYNNDIKHLGNSVKANDFLANELIRQVNLELQKPVDVTKFLRPTIDRALKHWEKAIQIYPDHHSSYENMAIVYSRIYKEHHKAYKLLHKVLHIEPNDKTALFNMGMVMENLYEIDSAEYYYQRCIDIDPDIINPRSRLANVKFMKGDVNGALKLNQEIMDLDENETLPYLNMGNYSMMMGDTLRGIRYFEIAVQKGAPVQVIMFLNKYYKEKGDEEKAESFRQKVLSNPQ